MIQSPDLEFGHSRLPASVLPVKTHSCITRFKFCKMQHSLPACKNICSSLLAILAKHSRLDVLGMKLCEFHAVHTTAAHMLTLMARAEESSSRHPAPSTTASVQHHALSFLNYSI